MRVPPAADDEAAGPPGPPVAVEAQRRLRPEQVAPQAALLKGSTAMARVQPLTPLTLHEAVLVGTQARTHAAPGRCAAPDWGPNEIPPYSPVLE